LGSSEVIAEVVSATRLQWWTFEAEAPLARSMQRLKPDPRLTLRISAGNKRGLPEIYNTRIEAPEAADILIFVHDDVFIDDFFIVDRLLAGLATFDVIGVAGNTRRVARQPSWYTTTEAFEPDAAHLSGAIAHSATAAGAVSFYGPAPAACELLDGVFLAVRKSTLLGRGVRFDPRFTFHFYDMDFCRSARQAGLTLGTWPIVLTHKSPGNFGLDWQSGLAIYLDKWGE
jgi:GT2 family glycosyltransferase